MRYWDPEPQPRDHLERQLRSDDPGAIQKALIVAAYHDPDWHWVQSECSRLSHHPNDEVRYVTVICLSHLARIHRQLDEASAEEMLTRLASDPAEDVTGTIPDVRGDFKVFLGRHYLNFAP